MGARWFKNQLPGTKAAEKLAAGGQQSFLPEMTRAEKMKASRKKTTDLTRDVIDDLNATGEFVVWRNNNIPSTRLAKEKVWMNGVDKEGKTHLVEVEVTKVYYKKNNIVVSTLDIIGYRVSDGRHLEIEVKTGKDTLDADQANHIKKMQAAGAISFAFGTFQEYEFQIKPFRKVYDQPF